MSINKRAAAAQLSVASLVSAAPATVHAWLQGCTAMELLPAVDLCAHVHESQASRQHDVLQDIFISISKRK